MMENLDCCPHATAISMCPVHGSILKEVYVHRRLKEDPASSHNAQNVQVLEYDRGEKSLVLTKTRIISTELRKDCP